MEDKITAARQLLKEVGYFTDNLWHIDDIMLQYECNKETAMGILKNALESPYIMECVFHAITLIANEKNLKTKSE